MISDGVDTNVRSGVFVCHVERPITVQVESALVLHPAVSEAAVVGFPDAIKGQAICCYVTFVEG